MQARDDSIFRYYINCEYHKRVLSRLKGLGVSDEEATPEMLEINLLKFHISISPFDYDKHYKEISQILKRAVRKSTINTFKRTLPCKVASHQQTVIENIMKYRCRMSSELIEGQRARVYQVLAILLDASKQASRFYGGDQFTVYLPTPDTLQAEKIIELIKDINIYCKEHQLRPGTHSDVAVLLTAFVNFRQELLEEDYNKVNYSGHRIDEDDKRLRIEAVDISNNNGAQARRLHSVEEIKANKLFQMVQKHFPADDKLSKFTGTLWKSDSTSAASEKRPIRKLV